MISNGFSGPNAGTALGDGIYRAEDPGKTVVPAVPAMEVDDDDVSFSGISAGPVPLARKVQTEMTAVPVPAMEVDRDDDDDDVYRSMSKHTHFNFAVVDKAHHAVAAIKSADAASADDAGAASASLAGAALADEADNASASLAGAASADEADACSAEEGVSGSPSLHMLLDTRDEETSWNVVHYLAALGANAELAAVLSKPQCPIHSTDRHGRSALLLALTRQKGVAARLLLKAQAAREIPWDATWTRLSKEGKAQQSQRSVEGLARNLAAADVGEHKRG